MSYVEDMGYAYYDIPDWVNNEEHWKNKVHYDVRGIRHEFKDIDNNYLMAIIYKFKKDWDIKPLLKEARKRKLL